MIPLGKWPPVAYGTEGTGIVTLILKVRWYLHKLETKMYLLVMHGGMSSRTHMLKVIINTVTF